MNIPQNLNGQATMANSQPVVVASNQSALPTRLGFIDYTPSTGNNTSAQLASSATFTGAIESILNHPNLIISIRSDQPFTLTIKQYSDLAGTISYPDIVYTRLANQGFNDTITIPGSYYRILIQNTGGSSTTNLFAETWVGILPVQPNNTNLGNTPIALNEMGGTALTTGSKSASSSIPVVLSQETASGNITTQNLVPAGVATANSAVEIILNGAAGLAIQTTGTYTGALSLQVTLDGTNWVTVGGTPLMNMNTGGLLTTITSALQSTFQAEVTGFLRARITALAAVTGTAVVTIRSIQNTPLVALDAALPTGANVIGALTSNQSVNVAQLGGTNVVNGGVAGVQAVGGNVAHSAATTANPVPTGGRVVPTTIATVDATLIANDTSWIPMTTGYQAIYKQFGTAELDYTTNFSSAVTTTTVQQIVPASGTASVRNYIPSLILQSDTITAGGFVWLLDGALTVSSIAITTGLTTTSTAHDLKVGDAVVFTALAGGTGVTTNTVYYVTAIGSTTTFNFSLTIGGPNVVPSVAYTGTTMYRMLYQFRLQATSAITTPIVVNFPTPLRGIANTTTNILIPTSLTAGNIYVTINGYRGF